MPYWDYAIDLNIDVPAESSIFHFINQTICLIDPKKFNSNFTKFINQLLILNDEKTDLLETVDLTQSFDINDNNNFNISNILQLFMIVSMEVGINSSNSGI